MPSWFMAMPSQMPIVANSKGVPPAMRTPSFTAWAILSRWMWPGISSDAELAMPIIGLSSSSGSMPTAQKSDLCGAFSIPFFHLIRSHSFSLSRLVQHHGHLFFRKHPGSIYYTTNGRPMEGTVPTLNPYGREVLRTLFIRYTAGSRPRTSSHAEPCGPNEAIWSPGAPPMVGSES